MYEQAIKDGIDPNNLEQMTSYIQAKQQGVPLEDQTAPQVAVDEPTTPEETAAALAAAEKKTAEDSEEPQTPEQTKAALAAMAAKKDPTQAIKQAKAKEVKPVPKPVAKPAVAKKAEPTKAPVKPVPHVMSSTAQVSKPSQSKQVPKAALKPQVMQAEEEEPEEAETDATPD